MTILTQPTPPGPHHVRRQPLGTGPVLAGGRRVERGAGAPHGRAGVDPFRVLRRYIWAILAAGVLGAVLGTAAFFLLNEFYPLYSGDVVFEVRPGLQKSTDVGTFDTTNDDLVFRIAQTETYMLTSRDILEAALRTPDVQKTKWAQQFYIGGTFSLFKAMDDLEDDLGTSARRSSNLFTLQWSAHKREDVPVVLNAIAQAYLNNRRQRDFVVYDKNLAEFNGQLDTTQRDLGDVDSEIAQLIVTGGL